MLGTDQTEKLPNNNQTKQIDFSSQPAEITYSTLRQTQQ
jgi:hypothetical protein